MWILGYVCSLFAAAVVLCAMGRFSRGQADASSCLNASLDCESLQIGQYLLILERYYYIIIVAVSASTA